METEKSRSESPFSRNKIKANFSNAAENGNSVIEQKKSKKKSLRNKCKSQSNDKDDDTNSTDNGLSEEGETANEMGNNDDFTFAEHENGMENGSKNLINDQAPEKIENSKENDKVVSNSENNEEKISNGENSKVIIEECNSTEDVIVNVEDCPEETSRVTESVSCNETETLQPCDSLATSGAECENSRDSFNGGIIDTSTENTNSLLQAQEPTKECSETKSQNSNNESDASSHYEEANGNEEHIQTSPDTATAEEFSISNRITNFFEKWTSTQEQKNDSEVSSSKKVERIALNHPYLSKVSGRPGIRDRLNSSATVFSSKELEAKTPENSGISLNDSFRVRTNPPCLSSLELEENPTLRKFKAKRCLNAGHPEEDEDIYLNTVKKRKLNDKDQDYGLFDGLFRSPFRKKTYNSEDQLKYTPTESKLSRLLSPFWFWKKTATNQKEE